MSRSLQEVVEALNNPQVIDRFIKFPKNFQELHAARNRYVLHIYNKMLSKLNHCPCRFYEKFNFRGAIGVIDCTHVAIIAPDENEHVYVNRKNYHSINVQLVNIV